MAASVSVPTELLSRVIGRMRPEQVWLFGSRARDESTDDSDWDLLVVLPDDALDSSVGLGGRLGPLRPETRASK